MIGDIFIFSAVNDNELDLLLENTVFPLTKADILHEAEVKRVAPHLSGLIRNLPSRFYRSRGELISQCISRSVRYSRVSFTVNEETAHARLRIPRW